MLEIVSPTLFQKNIEIQCSSEFSKPAYLFGVPERLEQGLIAIVKNAAESMNDIGGIITIKMSTTHEDGCETNTIQITDNGKGISKESLPHVFNPFYTTRTNENHVGIGLTIARKLIQ